LGFRLCDGLRDWVEPGKLVRGICDGISTRNARKWSSAHVSRYSLLVGYVSYILGRDFCALQDPMAKLLRNMEVRMEGDSRHFGPVEAGY
jgi:hypothetical protein